MDLFRNRPTLAPELLRDALHAPVPAFDSVRFGDPTLGAVVPTEYRADLVVLLDGPIPDSPRAALVVEAQLARDPDKRWSWPVYLATLRGRLRCDVALLVVTPDASVAAWAATPIPTGHPGWALAPLVLGPTTMPAIHDVEVAARAPELAVLSAVVHGHDDDAGAIAKAAVEASYTLDEERAGFYHELVWRSVHDGARAILEALMMSGKYEYQSPFARRHHAMGKAEGRAQAVLHVLEVRGIGVSPDVRERILACTDVAVLDTWLTRAVTVSSASEVVAE